MEKTMIKRKPYKRSCKNIFLQDLFRFGTKKAGYPENVDEKKKKSIGLISISAFILSQAVKKSSIGHEKKFFMPSLFPSLNFILNCSAFVEKVCGSWFEPRCDINLVYICGQKLRAKTSRFY